ncbi:tRNA nucleotidyltransferase (CCA-adding enzyme) [Paucidesulfovibrio gracilis DSM 16080]|uniref:tRNA nucleotidyltransferase (CCA-adding enzyme) n=1 Tax=Paucidesulfovibrio gracilis DSM 16080 TaxID=1121449 RepID=A0A1T4WN36_9BACT|nr:CBS domain-containing protein [Paucidesulfovibrio gracilis]SKA78770.1 tRNA nucleotidyltransferase (CCA-adding enzyme) [Paucidesulfovibrio gracilis DSM 16080]
MSTKGKKIQAHTVITGHANADFDALAAMVAAAKLYPGAVLIFPGTQEKDLRNFYIQSTIYLFNFRNFKEIDQDAVELLVLVDTRQRSRVPHVEPLLNRSDIEIHSYDHHPDSDEDVPAVREVVKSWGSTTSILVHEMMRQECEINSEEATVLGLGIFEDTGSFTFNSTVPEDFEAASWLRGRGMDLNVISDLLSRELSAQQIAILGELLESATTHDINGVEVVITQMSADHYVNDFALLIHKLVDMENIRVLFALGRMGDRIHLVGRSRSPDVDAGQICSSFGGGGHPYAASATIKDKTLAETRDDLFALLYSLINPQLVVNSIMSRPAVVVEDTSPMRDAVEIMTRYGFKGLPVVREGGMECVGLLEHAVADKALAHQLGEQPVSDYMGTRFATVPPDTDLYKVMEIILGKRQRLLPVIKNDQVVGIITKTDLLNLLIEEPARIPESLKPERNRERSIVSVMRERLPRPLVEMLRGAGELAQSLGYGVYAVGGFVRDLLLARPNMDLDLVVEGDGIAFARAFAEQHNARVKAHHKFKTAVVIFPDNTRIDVATARLEYYERPAALPTVQLSSIKMDLYRRDFTVNALAVNLTPGSFGTLVDFFGAQRDIKGRNIRVLHSLSFVEDPTRILRAVRFERRFEFQIGGQTLRLIKNALQLNLFNRLSGARIFHELQLIMEEEHPTDCLKRLQELKVLQAIHPLFQLTAKRIDILEELEKVRTLYTLLYVEPPVTGWKLFFQGLTMNMERNEAAQLLRRLGVAPREEREHLSTREMVGKALGKLMQWREGVSRPSDIYFALERLPLEGVLFLMAKSRKDAVRKHISQYLTTWRFHTLEVSGTDLKQLGLSPGPDYTRILRRILAAAIDGEAPGREDQLAMAARLVKMR